MLGNGAGSTEGGNFGVVPWSVMSSRSSGCVGRPPAGQEVRIADDEGSLHAPGNASGLGEILVRGAQVGRGYWNAEDRTKETFKDNWLHTGDVGWFDDDGYLYLADRKEELIISGGENVYPLEVEEILFHVEGVLDAAAVGMPDVRWGESVVAVIVAKGGMDIRERILEECGRSLAAYKRPRTVVLVDEIPRTMAGKIQKNVLRDIVRSAEEPSEKAG